MLTGGDQPVSASGEFRIDLARRELQGLGSPIPVGERTFEFEILAQAAGEPLDLWQTRIDVAFRGFLR